MYLEDYNALISQTEDKIANLRENIKKKEDDYEDMRQAKEGLSRVEEAFQDKKQKHQTVFNNVFFQRNRCMQRLSVGMTNHLAGNKTSVSEGIGDIERRMSDLLKDIDEDEQKLDRYLNRLSRYRSEARTAVSRNAVEG